MSVMFYATLAGERLDSANHNYEQARYWNLKANQLEDALLNEQDNNWRLQHQLNEARELNASWQAHAQQLEDSLKLERIVSDNARKQVSALKDKMEELQ